ncbi:hypothetical protein COCC4DRAFT_79558 [Bipolaris maydis ATCC 48331]|uniref:2EXR domain-containing protein n=2 Tax=Cochliobolus heterostrophus TaxID=5016 RepID=M2V2K7_COCH5|nr:uncharacterized protein COCC4DRAFT_79558 [Bipolaris maydis ATCC 48331]EMD94207.1 hypothetical protein COCHEDRAFT_1201989 [Bipolaris maydis C5]ENI07496.1 hypothetical protein COCC4DRAFT_79558 [Bipolaris maydis ATCC 48331]KAJ6209651.1 hypothetical protein PSV09DRAFT_1201989 [Bipolaris maydis]
MAPQKPAANDKAPKAKKSPTDKQSKDKVVKRPARGYHTFRNGMLNVTPKGGEKDMRELISSSVKANQQSPLLRLPAEVRNMIWEFALGRRLYEIKPRKVYGRRTYPRGDPSEVSLLRVCRQIYAEAASIPLRQNTFLIADPLQPEACLSTFKCYQRRQITSLRFECSMPYPVAYLLEAMDWLFFILKSSMKYLSSTGDISAIRSVFPTATKPDGISYEQPHGTVVMKGIMNPVVGNWSDTCPSSSKTLVLKTSKSLIRVRPVRCPYDTTRPLKYSPLGVQRWAGESLHLGGCTSREEKDHVKFMQNESSWGGLFWNQSLYVPSSLITEAGHTACIYDIRLLQAVSVHYFHSQIPTVHHTKPRVPTSEHSS